MIPLGETSLLESILTSDPSHELDSGASAPAFCNKLTCPNGKSDRSRSYIKETVDSGNIAHDLQLL